MIQHTAILTMAGNGTIFMTLNDPYPQFQGHIIFWRWISRKRHDIQTDSMKY